MKFSWVVLLAIVASVQLSSANIDCPKKPYVTIPPATEPDKLILTLFYDADPPDTSDKKNEIMLQQICEVLHLFKKAEVESKIEVNFKMGASSSYDKSTNTLYCNNCDVDMREACTAKHIPEFVDYLWCKLNPNNPRSASECDAELDPVNAEKIETCLSTEEGKNIILENSKLRSEKQVPICWLPHLLYNGVNGCFTFKSAQELLIIICAIYNLLKIPVSVCQSLPQGVQKVVEGIQGLKEEVNEEMKEEMKEKINEAITAAAVGIAIVDAGIEIVGQGVQKVKEEVKEIKEGVEYIQDAAKEEIKEEVDEKVADVAEGINTANAIVQQALTESESEGEDG